MNIWIVTTKEGNGIYADDKYTTFTTERHTVEYVGEIVAGNRHVMEEDVKLVGIFKVDTTYEKVTRLEPALENFKLVLKEKK